ncbi:MAG: hypothetical protein QXO51_03260 [Halobacteria archaeon]
MLLAFVVMPVKGFTTATQSGVAYGVDSAEHRTSCVNVGMFARLSDWFHLRQMRWRGTERVASVVLVAFIGMNVFAFLGRRMGMSPRAARSILRAL